MEKHKHHKFWMVWSPQGRAPTYKHTSREHADREAARLAKANPEREFFVLKAVGGTIATAPTVSAIKLRQHANLEIPF
jgi:hypothetical protein